MDQVDIETDECVHTVESKTQRNEREEKRGHTQEVNISGRMRGNIQLDDRIGCLKNKESSKWVSISYANQRCPNVRIVNVETGEIIPLMKSKVSFIWGHVNVDPDGTDESRGQIKIC